MRVSGDQISVGNEKEKRTGRGQEVDGHTREIRIDLPPVLPPQDRVQDVLDGRGVKVVLELVVEAVSVGGNSTAAFKN